MFKKIQHLDHVVVSSIEKLCHQWQRQTGWTNFSVAKCVPPVRMFVDYFNPSPIYTFGSRSELAHVFSIYVLIFVAEKIDSVLNQDSNPRGENPFKEFLGLLRFPMYVIAVLDPIVWCLGALMFVLFSIKGLKVNFPFSVDFPLNTLDGYLFLIIIVLMSCTPLPPCSGDFWNKFKFNLSSQTA